jgi:hypothetical protein
MTSICIRKNFHGVPGFIYAFFRVPGIPFVKIAYTRATGGGLPHAMPAELYSQFWAKGDRLRLGNLEAHTPAMPSASSSGWAVCRCHGARGEAPTGRRNGRYRHGGFTKAALAERRAVSKLVREARASIARLG